MMLNYRIQVYLNLSLLILAVLLPFPIPNAYFFFQKYNITELEYVCITFPMFTLKCPF